MRKNSREENEIAISVAEIWTQYDAQEWTWLVVMGVTGLYKCVCLGIFKLRASSEFKTKSVLFRKIVEKNN